MTFATTNGIPWPAPCMPDHPNFERQRIQRILMALGRPGKQGLQVDPDSLARYYDYLSARLDLPFAACYPRPVTRADEIAVRCQVIELLDPRTDLCDEFDGLYCRTRKGKFLVNLPLVELTILPPNSNLQLLADYEYWFWHYRP